MKKLFTSFIGTVLVASMVQAGAVTNVITENTPWGDTWREKAITVFNAYQTVINAVADGSSIALASNKVFIGQATGKAGAVTPSGLFTFNTAGVATASSTGLAITNATATSAVTVQAPSAVTPTITVTLQTCALYDSTGAACTNIAGETVAVVTNVTATCSTLPVFVTNATATVTITPATGTFVK